MATIKNTSSVLGNLVNQINNSMPNTPTTANTGPIGGAGSNLASRPISIDDDSIPAGMLEMEPVFEINYKSTKKQCMKKAKDQVSIIVKEVVPQILQNSTMIQDKINQDGEQLGNLYYEYAKSDVMIQALMETIARGDTQARLFEVYTKMTDQQQKLSSKITETQNQMRKYYIDTYLDLQQKDEVDDNLGIGVKSEVTAIEAPKVEQPEEEEKQEKNVIVGTDNVVKLLQEKKRNAMMAKYQEVKDN